MKKANEKMMPVLALAVLLILAFIWMVKGGYIFPTTQTATDPGIQNSQDLDAASKDLDSSDLNSMDSDVKQIDSDSSDF